MGRTCFIAAPGGAESTTFTYHETSRRTGRKEFFVFIRPARAAHDPPLRELFRRIVSSSRLGHPVRYLQGIVEAMDALPDGEEDASILGESIFLVVLRLGEEFYILRNRRIEPVHYDAALGREGTIESLPDRSAIPLEDPGRQGELFEARARDRVVLERFTMPPGEHTILMTPSREFVRRYRGVLLDSILFPSFEVPEGGEIRLETSEPFPAIHWRSAGTEYAGRPQRKRGSEMIRRSAPIVAGAVALIAAVILIFDPFGGERTAGEADGVLMGTADGGRGRDEEASTPVGGDGDRDESADLEPSAATERPRAEATGVVLAQGWRKKFGGPVTSSPAICGDLVVFGCRDAKLYAYSTDGTLRWTYAAAEGIGASPLCLAGGIVGADYEGNVFCVGAGGERLWGYRSGERIVSSPRLAADQVIVCTMGGRVIALSQKTGERLWSQKIGEEIWATPSTGSQYIVAASTEGSLVRLALDGSVIWRVAPGGSIHSSPLCLEDEGLVVVGTGDSYLFGYSLADGSLMWRFAAGSEIRSAPIAAGETVVAGTESGMLFAVDIRGREIWKRSIGEAIRSRPLVVNGVIFITAYDSKLSAFRVTDGSPVGDYRAESPLYSSPAYHAGRIFFGSNGGFLHAPSVSFTGG